MIAAKLISRVRQHGADVVLRAGSVTVLRPRRLDRQTIEALRDHIHEVRGLLEGNPVAPYVFTRGSRLCSRCKGLGTVAVIDGDLVCTFCVVSEAERLMRKGPGS